MKLRHDHREARRQGARQRFKILPFNEWSADRSSTDRDAYEHYVSVKKAEAHALGVTP